MKKLSLFATHSRQNSQNKSAVNQKFSERTLSPSPIRLSNFLNTRNSFKKDYQQKLDLSDDRMKTIMKQRAIARKGNLIIQQLNLRKNMLEKANLQQINRQQCFMQQFLRFLESYDNNDSSFRKMVSDQMNNLQQQKYQKQKQQKMIQRKSIFNRQKSIESRQDKLSQSKKNINLLKYNVVPSLNLKSIKKEIS